MQIINSIAENGEDGITVKNEEKIIEDTIFDFRDIPIKKQDEVLSGVNGARVTLKNCIIINGIKAILAGNGNYPIIDYQKAVWNLENCVILGSGRRCPEAQDGTKVFMKNCWIHNYGQTFDVRAFGAWAHRGGVIIADHCIFTQSGGLFSLGIVNTIKDIIRHIGQAFNDVGITQLISPKTYMPGICRALTADTGGLVIANMCYRNHWWMKIENIEDRMNKNEAREIVLTLDKECPNIKNLVGYSLIELFDTI